MAGRVVALATAVVAAVVLIVVLLGGGTPYELHLRFTNAGQLVKGNVVTVGGLHIGTVKDIQLTPDNQAEVKIAITDDDFRPLHAGTRADIRISSLSSVANRVIAITPGPQSAPKLADGAFIPATDTSTPVEIDQIVSTLDAETRSNLQTLIHGGAQTYAGSGATDANRTLAALNPAISATAGVLDELDRDQAAFRGVVVDSASVLSTLSAQSRSVDGLIGGAADLTRTLATKTGAIDAVLRRAPSGLNQATSLFGAYATAFGRLTPDARRISAISPLARETVDRLRPTLTEAAPALRDIRPLVVSLTKVLRGAPTLAASGVPALRQTATAVHAAMPIVTGALPYVPDILHGVVGGFGGQTAAGYDANGNYVRIAPLIGQSSLTGALSSLDLLHKGKGPSAGNVQRCPGAAGVAPDTSSPLAKTANCDASETP